MATTDIADSPLPAGGIATPRSKPSLLSQPFLPSLAARVGAWMAARFGCVLRLGSTVVVIRHADVLEVLGRDLDFLIGPINAARIAEVNGPFVLGMDRGHVLDHERAALYRAFHRVDMTALREQVRWEAQRRIAAATDRRIDAVGGFARPIAALTAASMFGVRGSSEQALMDVARAIFAHTFLNIENEEVVRKRAVQAGAMMRDWIADEIGRRLVRDEPGHDLMGELIRLQRPGPVDTELVRRTLGGMLVGAIDTTATCVAKIVAVLGRDKALAAAVAGDVDHPERLSGWCWEALRRWPHNPVILRQAAATTTLNGHEIRQGDRVFVWTQAAMLDATVFPDPERLRPDRPVGNYLHFGGALHACAGRVVNGFQIPILVGELVKRGIVSVGKMAWAGPFPDELPVVLAR